MIDPVFLQKRPPDNALYVKTCSKNPKKTKWWYHGNFYFSLHTLTFIVTNLISSCKIYNCWICSIYLLNTFESSGLKNELNGYSENMVSANTEFLCDVIFVTSFL